MITGAGAGSRPLHTSGSVYLAGPYKGAPLSLVTVVPAVSGPYDLGNVVVRSPIFVDPTTAQTTTVADEIPQILAGIPLRLRSLRIDLDRPGFKINPTNCDRFAISGQVIGSEGATAEIGAPFQVANCASLPYAPSLSLRLSGGIKRLGHPAIHAVFKQQPGEANSRIVQVALPKNEILDNAHIGNVCTRPRLRRGQMPGELADRRRRSEDAPARPAAQGQRLPADQSLALASRRGRRPQGPDRHRSGGPRRLGQERRPADHRSNRSPTPRSASSSSTSLAARRACWRTARASATRSARRRRSTSSARTTPSSTRPAR